MSETTAEAAEPEQSPAEARFVDRHWGLVCVLCVFPLAAILHYTLTFHTTCMLNPFYHWGNDYSNPTLLRYWLTRDPALWAGMLIAHIGYHRGLRMPALRTHAGIFLVATAPFTLWVWDIPFTNRVLCRTLHDDRLQVAGVTITGNHIFLMAFVLHVVLYWLLRRRRIVAEAAA